MANRSNHYEAAFEGYIRNLRVPCVAVDEGKRSLFGDSGVKNPDFLLYPGQGPHLVVEVKGKRAKNDRGRRPWENWVSTDDLDGLGRWETVFGPGFRSILVFAYAEALPEFPLPPGDGSFVFRHRSYRFWAIARDEYIEHLVSRGSAWKAVAMARREFRRRVRPLLEWLPSSYVEPKPMTVSRRRVRIRRPETTELATSVSIASPGPSSPAPDLTQTVPIPEGELQPLQLTSPGDSLNPTTADLTPRI